MKLTRVYSCLTLGFLTIFTIGCSASNPIKNVVDLSTNSAKADEQPVVNNQDNTAKESTKNAEQDAAKDIEYSPTSPEDIDQAQGQAGFIAWIRYANIPFWVRKEFFNQGLNKRYSFLFRDIRPLYLRGDFNGDRKPDIAVMLKDKTPKNNAFSVMAIFHGGTKKVIVIDDLNKLGADDIWEVVSRAENQYVRIPSSAKGECISMAKAMSASRLIYWDGNQYQSAQTSD